MLYGILIIISLIMVTSVLRVNVVREQPARYKFLLLVVLITAVSIRIVRYGSMMGLNVDEAMGGGTAWCLLHYGVDYHLMKWPVYLIAWGSGMNVLYPLVSIPIIRLFGLNVLSYRFPMVFLSILSLFILYYALMKSFKKYPWFNLLFITVLYLNPWMIMANRWALESYFFPIVMIFALAAFILFIRENNASRRTIYLLSFSIMLAMSAYAYSNNWIMLGVFTPILFGYLLLTKQITLKQLIFNTLVIIAIIWPLLTFIYVNYVSHRTLHILGLTIPMMLSSRANTQMILGNANGHLFSAIVKNICDSINMFMNGDSTIWNSLPVIGLIYPGMFIVAMVGLCYSITHIRKSILNTYMLGMICAGLPIICLVYPNGNHMDALIVPLFYFETIGLGVIARTSFLKKSLVVVLASLTLWFTYEYFVQNRQSLANGGTITSLQLKSAVKYASKTKKQIYLINNQNPGTFAVVRFYYPISPYKFNKERPNNFYTNGYSGYGKWHFTSTLEPRMGNVKHALFIIPAGNSAERSEILTNARMLHKYGAYDMYEVK